MNSLVISEKRADWLIVIAAAIVVFGYIFCYQYGGVWILILAYVAGAGIFNLSCAARDYLKIPVSQLMRMRHEKCLKPIIRNFLDDFVTDFSFFLIVAVITGLGSAIHPWIFFTYGFCAMLVLVLLLVNAIS